MRTGKKILVVEDSKMFGHAITEKIITELGYTTSLATTYGDAQQVLHDNNDGFFAAVLDLILPDAPNGEVVDYVLEKEIPTIVLTSTFSYAMREECVSKNIVDYIVKEGPHSLDNLIKTLRRLEANTSTKILVVDDSKLSRKTITDLLLRHRFITFEAPDGKTALTILSKHPDIRAVITDYEMPNMDGFTLIEKMRQTHSMDQMAIIGVSGSGGSIMSAKFLKKGANDFIVKPFCNEEFFLRINQNLQMLDYLETIRETAVRDHLTGLYNRRYFFEIGQTLFKNALRKSFNIVLAMIDIDFFKNVNDTFGHGAGDEVLSQVATILADHFRSSDVVARLGGEEFCVMAPNMAQDHAFRIFDELRSTIEAQPFSTKAGQIKATVSIGLTLQTGESLEDALAKADQLLYQAKEQGRNQVIAA